MCRTMNFNPRSPHGERRVLPRRSVSPRDISIHAPRTGSDTSSPASCCRRCHFNPRSPHGERQRLVALILADGVISIHAPRTGSDGRTRRADREHLISIHAPRTGSDWIPVSEQIPEAEFQSTLPARGATPCAVYSCHQGVYFNPRSPHGERQTT